MKSDKYSQLKNDILVGLNTNQKAAVLENSQHLRIIAGAGTGKTSVLTKKIAYLIASKKTISKRILALTFTNKAANEMKERVKNLIGLEANETKIFTFHSLCNLILKIEAKEFQKIKDFENLDKNFNIIDDKDQKKILKDVYEKLQYSLTNEEIPNFRKAIDFISYVKNKELTFEQISSSAQNSTEKKLVKIYKNYTFYMNKANVVDFDDLQIFVKTLFLKIPEVAKKWSSFFDYILVDEFQDTSSIQYEIVKLLVSKKTKLIVVGDPDQTIYSWRGADVNLILNLEKDFPKLISITLDKNYRSHQIILDAANSLIANNKNRIKKNLISSKETEGIEIKFFDASNQAMEFSWIISEINDLKKNKVQLKNIAILYRQHFYAKHLEDELFKENIPYKIVGNTSFNSKKEIRDAINFLRVINDGNVVAFSQIINIPSKKIGPTILNKLNSLAEASNKNLFDFLMDFYSKNSKSKREQEIKIPLAKENQKKLIALLSYIKAFRPLFEEKEQKFDILLKNFLEKIDYFSAYKHETGEKKEAQEVLEKFYASLRIWQKHNTNKTLREYLDDSVLSSDLDNDYETNTSISLMTIHAAKGLEFQNVFLIGMSEGIFPTKKTLESYDNDLLEEERRLAFVAVTRAKERLFISYSRSNFLSASKINNYKSTPISTFVSEMKLKSEQILSFSRITAKGDLNYTKSESTTFYQGDLVNHIKFGQGIVLNVESETIDVEFFNLESNQKIRTILKNHKSIEKIEKS
ncbi:ATP-dependent helicase [Mycoplasma sp. 1654_15]|uniref:ATP-dependent helicase n=1 Tax=Mycoplasma sp. 1654_15 TaxID=2725994 RepID=UPI0014491725|nr:UvrD-helicase domain-containing protein [Mycoplasma sp. 1654_15]QJB71333.1 UvrD-helicase domain-containing protein [Mycoplasma sp. 1654_15]